MAHDLGARPQSVLIFMVVAASVMRYRLLYSAVHPRSFPGSSMRVAKPLLLITTPIGVVGGVYEAFRLAGGLAFVMVAMLLMISAAMGMLVMTIRAEQRTDAAAAAKQEIPQ